MLQRPSQPRARFGRHMRSILTLAFALPAFAQSTDSADESSSEEDVIELSPFQVDTTTDQGYFAQNTLAGSRLRTNVADLGSSITVVTAQQLEDTASVDINDVFRYEANTEGASTYTPSVQSLRNDGVVDGNAGFTSGATGAPQTVNTANRIRGIGSPGASQNYYPSISGVPFDAYNVQSIEISRGPNSMLFGMGSPAGIVNQTTAKAVVNRDSTSVTARFDDRGSYRGSFSFNKSIIDDKLAIYGAALSDNRRFERKPSYDDTTRLYGALTFRPFQKTVLRGSFEYYENDHRRPNTLTPRDGVTQWRTGGAFGFDPSTGMIHKTSTGEQLGPIAMRTGSGRIEQTRAYIRNTANYNPALWNADQTTYNGARIYGGTALTDPNSIFYSPGMSLSNNSRPKMQIVGNEVLDYSYYRADQYRATYGTPTNPTGNAPVFPASGDDIYANGNWDAAWNSVYSQSDFHSALNNGIGSYRYPGVSDKSIYDWEKVNILNMNFGATTNNTINLELEQEILPNLHFSAGWFFQDYENTTNYTVSQLNVATLFVDTNVKRADGSANPMFGQPFVYDFDPDQFLNFEENDNYRAMLAWTPDFTDNDNWTKWLGRHQVSALATKNHVTKSFWRKRWFITDTDEESNNTIFLTRNPNNNLDGSPTGWKLENRSVQRNFYLAGPGSQPYGQVTRASGRFDNSSYNGRMNYYDWSAEQWQTLAYTTGYIDHSAHTGRTEREVDSYSAGITSHLWDDRLVATFGVRQDDYRARNTTSGAILAEAGGAQIAPGMTNQEKWVDGYYQTETVFNRWNYWDEVSGTTNTLGGVLRPFSNWNNIEDRAAEGSMFHEFVSSLGFSYNKSDNFNPPPSAQVDAFGNPLPKPTGEGEDFGLQFSLMDNKLFARVNWFKMTNENERTNPGTSISRLTNNVDTSLFRKWAETIALINMGLDPIDASNFNTNNFTPAQIDQWESAAAQIWQLPYTYYADVGSIYATRSAEAEGIEFQVSYNPNRNWTMKFTFGQQETKYANVLKEFDAWFDHRNPVWSGARAADYLDAQYQGLSQYTADNGVEVNLTDFWNSYGYASQIRLGDQFGNESAQLYYDNVVTPQYAIASDLEGQAAPGQRKNRWSYLTNYTFDEGALRGWSVGGSVRWEDQAVIGYFGKPNAATGSSDLTLSDVNRPIFDEANTYTDLWFSYTTKVFSDKVRMKVQLNVANVFESGGLRVVGVNYDGSPNAYRIVDPRRFILSTKFDF